MSVEPVVLVSTPGAVTCVARFLLDERGTGFASLPRKEHSLNARIVLVALSLACYGLFGTLANEWARPVAVQEATYGMSIETPASLPHRSRRCRDRLRRCRRSRRQRARGATRRLCGRLFTLSRTTTGRHFAPDRGADARTERTGQDGLRSGLPGGAHLYSSGAAVRPGLRSHQRAPVQGLAARSAAPRS